MNASIAIQVLPDTRDEDELIRIVDEVIAYIKSTGLNCSVGPFETTIEGDYDQLMDIVKECQKLLLMQELSLFLPMLRLFISQKEMY